MKDFTEDHARLAELWGYPPKPVPQLRPEEHSRPGFAPFQDPNAPSSAELLRQRHEKTE